MSMPLVAPDRRISVGRVVSLSFKILFKRFWAFLGFAALPMVAFLIGYAALIGALIAGLPTIIKQGLEGNATPAIIAGIVGGVLLLALLFVYTVFVYKCTTAAVRMALDLADGRPTSFGDAWRSTGNMTRRVWLFVVAVVGAVIVLYGALSAVIFLSFIPLITRTGGGTDSSAGGAVALGVLTMVLVGFLVWLAAIYFGTRFYYMSAVMAVEPQTTAFQALGRSWQLTRGWFWPTLGYLALFALVNGVIQGIVSMFQQFASLGVQMSQLTNRGQDPKTIEDVLGFIGPLFGILLISTVVSVIVTTILTCVQLTYQAMVYLARTRDHLPPEGMLHPEGPMSQYQPQGAYPAPAGYPGQPAAPQQAPVYGQGDYGVTETSPTGPTAPTPPADQYFGRPGDNPATPGEQHPPQGFPPPPAGGPVPPNGK